MLNEKMKTMKYKKSQMEIMGLAIIVVLIVIGMLFVVKFMMSSKPAEHRKNFVPDQLSTNIGNTFLNSNSRDCRNLILRELIEDCANEKSIYCDDGKLSCSVVSEAAKEILNKTLDKWNYDYFFSIYYESGAEIVPSVGEECPGERKSNSFPISTDAGTIYLKIDICG